MSLNVPVYYDDHNGVEHFDLPKQLTYDCDLTIFTFLSDILRRFTEYNNGIPDNYIKLYEDHDAAFEAYQRDVKDLSDDFAALKEQSYEEGQYSDDFKFKVNMAFAKLQLLLQHLWW